jgi:uncharacterized membrane protein YcaP (DUF421 family)
VQDGKLIERNLRGERLTLDDVMEKARGNEIESLEEIKFAVVEASGTMSFLKK